MQGSFISGFGNLVDVALLSFDQTPEGELSVKDCSKKKAVSYNCCCWSSNGGIEI